MHVRKNRGNRAHLPRRFGSPRCSIKMFDNHLIHALIGGKDPQRSSPQLSLILVFTRAHRSPLLAPSCFPPLTIQKQSTLRSDIF
jgi:hypothetical protein